MHRPTWPDGLPSEVSTIAVFLPQSNPFYMAMFHGIARGFEHHGVRTVGWPQLLDEATLVRFVKETRPDAILEMNRWRDAAGELPADLPHLCWMVDSANQSGDAVTGSQMTYFFGANWLAQYPHRGQAPCAWLPPGNDPHHYRFATAEPRDDLAFIGHMPRPWSADELARALDARRPQGPCFGDAVELLRSRWSQLDRSGMANDQYLALVFDLLDIEVPPTIDRALRYDLSCRIVRELNRRELLDAALQSTADLRIYGSPNFREYPHYRDHYAGFLTHPSELAAVYRGAAINLHEGVGVHFRSLDCMASGGVLLVPESPDDHEFGGIAHTFEPGRSFASCRLEELPEVADALMADPARREAMARQAARDVAAGHTWAHRAGQILDDLRGL